MSFEGEGKEKKQASALDQRMFPVCVKVIKKLSMYLWRFVVWPV